MSGGARLVSSLAFVATVALVRPAASQDAAAQADALFDAGKQLMAAGDFVNGCAKLAESQRLSPGGGTLFTLAVCREKEGRTATAWGLFKEASVIAKRDGRKDRASFADERVAALGAQIPYLTVEAEAQTRALAGLVVAIDGVPMGAAALGTPLPIDPGRHTVVARAPGYQEWSASVETPPGARASLRVAALSASVAPATTARDEAPPRREPGPRSSPVAGYALLGIGAVGLSLATFLVFSGRSDARDSEALCPTTRCASQEGLDANDRARTKGTWGMVAAGVGLASIGVGTYLLLRTDGGDVGFAPVAPGAVAGASWRSRW